MGLTIEKLKEARTLIRRRERELRRYALLEAIKGDNKDKIIYAESRMKARYNQFEKPSAKDIKIMLRQYSRLVYLEGIAPCKIGK